MRHSPLVLCLDGGGAIGYLSIRILERLYGVGAIRPADVVLYAGTSTGSLEAACLADGKTPAEIASLYLRHGATIFQRKWLAGYGARYGSEGLASVIADVFGDRRMDSIAPTVIVAVECGRASQSTKDGVYLFTNVGPDAKQHRIADALLASSAAPTYFPVHWVGPWPMIDGGVQANNPTLWALGVATQAGLLTPETRFLSIGTGYYGRATDPSWWGGKRQWLGAMLGFAVDGACQSDATLAGMILGDRHYRVNPDLPEDWPMDNPKLFPEMDKLVESLDLKPVIRWLCGDGQAVAA